MTDTNKCYKAIDRVCQAIFDMNTHYGQLLDDGLEERADQLYNLLTKQLGHISANISEGM